MLVEFLTIRLANRESGSVNPRISTYAAVAKPQRKSLGRDMMKAYLVK